MHTHPASIAATCALLVGVLVPKPGNAQQSDSAPRYSLREASPRTGSSIPLTNVKNSRIPFDKTYAELTAAEQALVKAEYEQMSERDEPPFPVRGLGPLYKAIALGQQKRLAVGDLLVVAEIDSKGDMASASIYKTPDDILARYVVALIAKEKFKPALCEGVPCAMAFLFRIALKTN